MKSLYAIAAGAALALLPASVKANDFENIETEVLDVTGNAHGLSGSALDMSELQPGGNEVKKYAFVLVASSRGKEAKTFQTPSTRTSSGSAE